jgi:hypothetical protein
LALSLPHRIRRSTAVKYEPIATGSQSIIIDSEQATPSGSHKAPADSFAWLGLKASNHVSSN